MLMLDVVDNVCLLFLWLLVLVASVFVVNGCCVVAVVHVFGVVGYRSLLMAVAVRSLVLLRAAVVDVGCC